MVERVSSLEELLHRSAGNRFKAVQIDHRSHLALELIADTLIALLAELQKPGADAVTSIPQISS